MFFKRILYYLDPRTMFKKGEAKKNINLYAMHSINRISIYMFLICIIVLIVRYCTR
ncbi:MAG TPA: DUF6728 family protein [Flavobacteriales bacterium]|nr:DUF6728 family protein [Flavobacteriales bacterium]